MTMFDGLIPFSITTQADPAVTIKGLQTSPESPLPPLLLLHGFPQTRHIWHRIVPHLTTSYRLIIPDLRGYGESSKPPSIAAYAKSAMAKDMIAVMDQLNHKTFFVCAHDRGARVAHKLLVDYPDHVRKAILLDICPTLSMYEATSQEFATAYFHWFFLIQPAPLPETLISATPRKFAELYMGGRDGKRLRVFDEACYEEYVRLFEDEDTVHAMCNDYRAAATVDLDEQRADAEQGRLIKAPVRIIWGKKGIVEKCFDAVAEWTRVVDEGVVVDGYGVDSGHYIPEEAPDEVVRAVCEFFVPRLARTRLLLLRLASPVRRRQPPSYPAISAISAITTSSESSSPASTYTPHRRQLSSFPPHPSAPTTCSYAQTQQPAPGPPSMAPVPATMKAVQVSKTGGIEVLDYKDVPVPTPKEGQVLIRNEFAGVNFIDTYFRSGLYKLSLPVILGNEAAGEVVSHHQGVTGFPPGTKVVYMDSQAYAQYTAVPASKVIALPAGLTTEQAAAVFLQGLTAWTFIREAGRVQPGQWALVHAAAGGVGQLLVQMLKSVGAKVIGTASTQEKCDLARKLGAGWTVSSKDDLVAKVSEITGGHGVDAIFDGVGAATFDADLQMIALKGHLVSFGNASGPVPDFSILRLADKNVTLLRPKVNGYVADRKDLEKYSAELFDQVISGQVKIAVHDVYPLKEVGRAHADLESRKTKGKLLLSVE